MCNDIQAVGKGSWEQKLPGHKQPFQHPLFLKSVTEAQCGISEFAWPEVVNMSEHVPFLFPWVYHASHLELHVSLANQPATLQSTN